jgi:hypothetical protein
MLGPAKVRVTFGFGMGDRKTRVEFLSGAKILLFAGTLIQVLGGTPSLLYNQSRGLTLGDKVTSYLHLVQSLRKHGAINTAPYALAARCLIKRRHNFTFYASGSQSVLRGIRHHFPGNPWIHLCNGSLKFTYFLITGIMFC